MGWLFRVGSLVVAKALHAVKRDARVRLRYHVGIGALAKLELPEPGEPGAGEKAGARLPAPALPDSVVRRYLPFSLMLKLPSALKVVSASMNHGSSSPRISLTMS